MTTLAEIEAAAEALPPDDKRRLLQFLVTRLGAPTSKDIAEGDRVVEQMRKTFHLTRFDDPDGPAASPDEWDALVDAPDTGA
ncbi:MAG: hypothetical protein ACFCVE_08600 [Phycisphaerae bacterium]